MFASRMLHRVPAGGLILTLLLALCCSAAQAAAPVAGHPLFVEAPEDHSGKSIEPDVLSSLHDELQAELGKSEKIAEKSDAQVLIHVEVTDYHFRNQASRWMLGAMSGKDSISSKVSLIEASSGATLYSTQVTTSTANQWRGEGSIARLHAREIVKTLEQNPAAK
jgi:Domain of unknown function (DUF4410)